MDLKVYRKEEVKQPSGDTYVSVPDVIDIYPEFTGEEGSEVLANAETLEDTEELEQSCALSTIWQRGLDPLDTASGNRWSQLFLGEINVLQIMDDITSSVTEVSPSVQVDFNTLTDANGNNYFSYTIKAVS